jgi:poly-gamma-glutamate synthesis protein (capsule biosynthesis protein)
MNQRRRKMTRRERERIMRKRARAKRRHRRMRKLAFYAKRLNYKHLTIFLAAIFVFLFSINSFIVKPIVSVLQDKPSVTTTVKKKTVKKKTPAAPSFEVNFKAVGDNVVHESAYKYANKMAGSPNEYDFSSIYSPIQSDLKNADLSFINQETIMGGDTPSGYPKFNTPDTMMNSLSSLGVDVVNANTNHTLDQGASGVAHMISLFKAQKKMMLLGIATNKSDYDTINYIEKNGLKFAFLSYTFGTNRSSTNRYNVKLFDTALIKKEIATAKANADFVIVSAHWGIEYTSTTNVLQDTYAKIFNQAGADVVIGTHPHVIQKMQWLTSAAGHKTLVAYSLGNFMSAQTTEARLLGGMLSCKFTKKNNVKSISNVEWIPLFTHIEASDISSGVINDISNMKIYKVKDYNDELAKKHILNKSSTKVTKASLTASTKRVIKQFTIDV